jgi:hypothetical protein
MYVMQLGLMSDRALFQAVSHFHLIFDAHVLFLNDTHGTSVIRITLEKVSLKQLLCFPAHYHCTNSLFPFIRQSED